MTTKEIRKALKDGKKVIFNRHIWGAPHGFERFPVLAVRIVKGFTYARFIAQGKPVWALVQPDLDDYVSIDFPPAEPVKFSEEV